MYSIGVKKDFIARHFLIGGDWGPENFPHAHHYQLELQLEGELLDQHQYLVDIVDIEATLNEQVQRFRDQLLNDLAEFERVNPSIELFSRLLCTNLSARIVAPNITALTVKLWENDIAWAAYRQDRHDAAKP